MVEHQYFKPDVVGSSPTFYFNVSCHKRPTQGILPNKSRGQAAYCEGRVRLSESTTFFYIFEKYRTKNLTEIQFFTLGFGLFFSSLIFCSYLPLPFQVGAKILYGGMG